MDDAEVRAQLEEILRDAEPGRLASLQTPEQIENPNADGEVEAWAGRKEPNGSVTIFTIWT
jgi:hypothetical protein